MDQVEIRKSAMTPEQAVAFAKRARVNVLTRLFTGRGEVSDAEADAMVAELNRATEVLKINHRPTVAAAKQAPSKPITRHGGMVGANPTPTAPVRKTAPPDDRTQREVALAELDTLAKAQAERDGTTFAKAYTAVLRTDRGRELYAQTRSILALERHADAVRKAGHYDRFGTPGDALNLAVKVIQKRDGVGYVAALRTAATEYPDLYALYREGNRW